MNKELKQAISICENLVSFKDDVKGICLEYDEVEAIETLLESHEQLQQQIDQLNQQVQLEKHLIDNNFHYKKQIEFINERNNNRIKQLENQNKIFLEQLTKQHLLDVKPIIVNLKELEE